MLIYFQLGSMESIASNPSSLTSREEVFKDRINSMFPGM